jgi:hypothetical protein
LPSTSSTTTPEGIRPSSAKRLANDSIDELHDGGGAPVPLESAICVTPTSRDEV